MTHIPPDDPHALPFYDEVPAGLIPVSAAARKYGIPRSTLGSWLAYGHLRRVGRMAGAAPGGAIVLISVADLERHIAQLPRPAGGAIYDAVPDGLITLDAAAAASGRPADTIRGWIRQGLLREVGRLRGRGAKGGALLVSATEFRAVLQVRSGPQRGADC